MVNPAFTNDYSPRHWTTGKKDEKKEMPKEDKNT
jgi:hypothetical protein